MTTAQIDGMVRAAVARAGADPAIVPGLTDLLCFHALMGNDNLTPERVGLLIVDKPRLAAALATETRASGLRLTLSGTVH